ncbi:MAG: transglutaminase family protein, partial [Paraglaciecola sp.]|nr:transglutaminase family protein [Paraglaciecola sp.]
MKENINIQGCLADAKLAAQNLILTQGGEPTFVPYDTTAPEWNLAALGPQKLKFARLMAQELTSTLFKGAVVMQSFGKHYPGEPLPRWQIGIYKSRSQAPLWNDLNRLRLGQEIIAPGDPAMPKQFIADLAAELGLADTSLPAYEDLEAKLKSIG